MKGVSKKTASLLLSVSLLTGSWMGSIPVNAVQTDEKIQQEFYVSVTGSDSGDGSQENPFATVERARQAVDEINDNMTGNIIVNIGAGDYYLDETLQFGASDSGTNGYEVIYRSSDGIGKANLIGGEKISGWELADETDVTEYDLDESLVGKVYKVQLDPEQYDFNTLYVNDERAVMARTRNRDNNPNFPMAKGEYMRSVGGHNNDLNMLYKIGDIDEKSIAGMVHAQERGEEEIAQVLVWDGGDWDWFTNTIPIASIDTEKGEFKFPTPPEDYPEKYRTKYNIGSGARYFLQGNLAFMDVEGEYHYNKTTGILYYYPKTEDGAIEEQTIIVPTMQQAIYFKGTEKENLADEPDPNQQVHNITLDGLAVKDTEFADYFTYSWNFGDAGAGIGYFPKAAEGSTNPSFCETTDREEFRVGSITLTGTHDITIINTRVKNSGMYGIIYAGDNQYNTLKDSVIEDTGYGGLIFDGGYPAIGKYNNHNTVENVLIHEVGDLVGHAVGMTLMSSGQNTFTNMEIFDTPKRAILVIGGYRRDRNGGDKNYDEVKDMYTVGNHFQYIHVHDAQQDAGEDSAVFLSWLLSGQDMQALHGSNDPNNLKTNLEGIDTSIDRYNYFDQMLITDVGADPSVIEKCTVGGLDTAMGASGSQFTNIKAANTQHHLLAIRHEYNGIPSSYGDMYGMENCTNNIYTDDPLKSFDDSKMEYDKIGLTETFPEEYRVSKREYTEAPDDLYFYDDFEASRQLDLTKWTVEKGNVEMHIGYGYMSEDPTEGKRSLPINADLNPNGVVVSRTFENDLNKIVEVKYLDRRKDYANNDRVDAVPTEILPNSFLRVDDGENALGLGAVGTVSKDYYQIKKGDELIQTNVKRYFGWHTFKFDYSSGTDVKLYIDDQLVATYDESDGVSTSFNYIGMGDWEGNGGKAFFDQLYVYGGKEAPPVEDLPLPTPPEAPDADLFAEDFESETPTEFTTQKKNAQVEVTAAPDDESNRVLHVTSPDDLVYFAEGMDWSNYTFECKIWIDNWDVSGTPQPWDSMAPVWNAGSTDDKGNFNRYSLKYRRDTKDFALYKRSGGDTDMVSAAAPAEYEGKWHDYKISTVDGLITAYIDGEKIFEHRDSSNTRGTIGFDGINVEYYVDDIKVTGQKTPDPTASLDSGTYPGTIQVELLPAASGHKIFYTLDGSDPTDPAHGLYYIPESTITIDKTSTLKFVAITDGSLYSNVIQREYAIDDSYTAEDALNDVTLESPEPKQTKLVLPERTGFAFEIVASSNEAIGIDGTIYPPINEVEVTLTIRATRLTDNTTAEKDFTVTVPGVGKNLNEVIEADQIDAVQGTYIKIENNEVFNFNGGDWIRYDAVNFGDTPKNIRFHIDTAIHPDFAGKKIHVMLDDPTDGVKLGTVVVGKVFKTNLKNQLDETFGENNWPATSGPLPEDEDGKFTVNTITVNQDRATLARTLNSEKFEGMPSTLFDNPLYTAGGSYTDMTYKQEDASKLFLEQLQNAQSRGDLSAQIVCNDIGGKRAWDSDTLPITNVDVSARKLTFNPNDVGDFTPLYAIGSDSRYYLQGNLAFLDTPGEFYYNPKTFDLYYYPQDGEEELEEQEIIVPTTDQVIRIEGERTGIWDDTEITPVQNLVFDGFTFSDTSFPDYYSSGYPWLPYASGSPSKYAFPEWSKQSSNPIYCGSSERPQFQVGTVHLQYTDHITIRNCNIRNAGMNGIEMYLGVTNTLVTNSLVEYCGNGGIMIEGGFPGVDGNSDAVSYTNHNTVENTIVHDVGQMVHQTFGIQVANATYNTIQNCEIYHSPRRGLLLMGSDIGSWNNTASGNRNWSPVAYDVQRDEYAHGNTFSNIYLHDVQQDGGDDGGLFAVFVYYNTHNFSRPNYFDQIVINEVGAQPNMSDISPNNINLDMGWCGIEMSNIKTVNPQHYTIENSNLQNGQVKVDNCTFYFKNQQDGLDSFDDSKMDYANIGVQTWRYPEEYRHAITNTQTERPGDLYFSEDFENELDWEKWSYQGNTPELSRIYMSEGPFNGKSALVLNNEAGGEKPVLYREFEETLYKTVTVKIFDRQLSPSCTYSGEGKLFPDTGKTQVRVDAGTEETLVAMGIDPAVDSNYYTINLNGEKSATPIRRVFGWHELTFDYSQEGIANLYIDGTQVGTAQREGFSYVALGSEDGTGENYYDQLYIYGGKEAAAAGKTETWKQEAANSVIVRNAAETYVDWKFEDDTDFPYNKDETYGTPFQQVISSGMNYSGVLSGNTMLGYFNTSFSVVENPVKSDINSSDYVLARSGEGGCHGYAQQDPEWGDYIWKFDYLYKSSSATAKDNSINFILNCQNKNDQLGSGYPYQPSGYWFSINEGENALILRKRNAQQGNPVDLARVTLEPEVFEQEFNNTQQWHTIAFYAKNGSGYTDLCVVVDNGKYVLEARDSSQPFTSGTIAFNSMGTDFYLDNIQIEGIEDSPLTGYDENFGLENAQLTEKFLPSITEYKAEITDSTQPVTMKKPNGAGAEYTIFLNGKDITADFSDTETPVVLDLKPGNNELVVSETTAQYVKTEYRISLYKKCTLVSTDIPGTISTLVGQMPVLPSACEVVVNDGVKDITMTSAVSWEMADQAQYKQPGSFKINGYLTELENEKVSVEIQVDGIISMETLGTVQCKAGTDPTSLLAKEMGVEYQYSGVQQKAISFKTMEPSVYAKEGTVIAVGTIDGYEEEILQYVELETVNVVDKGQLELLIEKAEEMVKNADKYVETNWQQLVDALAEAKKVMDDGDALEENVKAAAEALNQAILSQRYKADKENLEDLINKANEIDLSQYTAESVAVFQAALENANLVLADESLSEDDQGIVDEAVKTLAAAIENLSVAEENPSNPSDPDDGTETPSTPDQGEEGTETPPTGDSSSTIVYFTAILAVMMLAALLVMRRKNQKTM